MVESSHENEKMTLLFDTGPISDTTGFVLSNQKNEMIFIA